MMIRLTTNLGYPVVVQSIRSVFVSRSISAPGRQAIRPFSAVAGKANSRLERGGISLCFSPLTHNRQSNSQQVYCYSTKSVSKADNNDSRGVEGNNEKTNDQPQSPFSSPLGVGMATTSSEGSVQRPSTRKKKFVPRRAAVKLTEKARTVFQKLLYDQPTRDGILLDYKQSSTGQPRMVFSFRFVSKEELHVMDEGVSLEIDEDGNPKSPEDTVDDGFPKLYVHHNAFLKVLGATVDVNTETLAPVLYDKEGFELDANA
mmetsp:Transcript_16374/g.45224  ORF Transcript_16374/g.45224 Transcript_16374/m.45224 type:complete len:259 (+) Transcript_16374:122-898(+)